MFIPLLIILIFGKFFSSYFTIFLKNALCFDSIVLAGVQCGSVNVSATSNFVTKEKITETLSNVGKDSQQSREARESAVAKVCVNSFSLRFHPKHILCQLQELLNDSLIENVKQNGKT